MTGDDWSTILSFCLDLSFCGFDEPRFSICKAQRAFAYNLDRGKSGVSSMHSRWTFNLKICGISMIWSSTWGSGWLLHRHVSWGICSLSGGRLADRHMGEARKSDTMCCVNVCFLLTHSWFFQQDPENFRGYPHDTETCEAFSGIMLRFTHSSSGGSTAADLAGASICICTCWGYRQTELLNSCLNQSPKDVATSRQSTFAWIQHEPCAILCH